MRVDFPAIVAFSAIFLAPSAHGNTLELWGPPLPASWTMKLIGLAFGLLAWLRKSKPSATRKRERPLAARVAAGPNFLLTSCAPGHPHIGELTPRGPGTLSRPERRTGRTLDRARRAHVLVERS